MWTLHLLLMKNGLPSQCAYMPLPISLVYGDLYIHTLLTLYRYTIDILLIHYCIPSYCACIFLGIGKTAFSLCLYRQQTLTPTPSKIKIKKQTTTSTCDHRVRQDLLEETPPVQVHLGGMNGRKFIVPEPLHLRIQRTGHGFLSPATSGTHAVEDLYRR